MCEGFFYYLCNMNNVTGLTVCYETHHLLRQAIKSIRKHYPFFNILVIDGSKIGSPTWQYVNQMGDDHTAVYQCGFNIGHGNGMHLGMEMVTTDYVLIFDTDIVMQKPCVEEMLTMFQQGVYGVGWIIPQMKLAKWSPPMRYLHPYFKIISREQYFKHHRFVHHGAPCHKTYGQISLNGAKKKLLEYPVKEHVEHLRRGTRAMKPHEFLKGWVH